MAIGKKRTIAHIKGETGVQVLKKHLPAEWVPREYVPDYGIDLSIELFSPTEGGYVTKGEHVFFQVKATDSVEKVPYKIYPRMNVEKEYRRLDREPIEIEVIKFVLDTDLLLTVETMGSAVPVLLAVVDLSTENIYFVCLNDYIEKVLIPEDADYTSKDHKTIYIPAVNLLNSEFGTKVVEWYGKRGKLYALFNKIHYQSKELQYCRDYEIAERVEHFLKILLKSDAWSAGEYWGILDDLRNEAEYYLANGITIEAACVIKQMEEKGENVDDKVWEATHCDGLVSLREAQRVQGIHILWDKMANLGCIFEDLTKENFLPTFVAHGL